MTRRKGPTPRQQFSKPKTKTPPGRVRRLVVVDQAGNTEEWSSKQIPEDPFSSELYEAGLMVPPFDLEQLVWISEMHPVHAACLEQRASDVVGGGWRWEPTNPDNAPTEEPGRLNEAFNELAGPLDTMIEILHEVWLDYETCGVGYLELARDQAGNVKQVYHVPAHTVRAHADSVKYAQQRGAKVVWFVEWGHELKINAETGKEEEADENPANELLVFKKPTRRSSYYGIPNYVAAIGWIMLALAARDYNINFFRNLREPRWAIILSNLEGDDDTEEELQQAFTVDLAQPHRNLMASFEGEAKVQFQKLSEDQTDMGFARLLDMCIAKGSLVSTADGPVPIEQVRAGDEVWSWANGELRLQPVTKMLVKGTKETVEVRARGRVLRSTKDHKVLVLNPEGSKGKGSPHEWVPRWKEAGNLTEGELLVSLDHLPSKEGACYLLDGTEITEDVAWLVGAILGDGHVHQEGVNVAVFDDVRKRVERVFSEVWGLDSHNGHNCVRFNSRGLRDVLDAVGLRRRSHEKVVPPIVWRLSEKLQRAFLEGYQQTDGHLLKRGAWAYATASDQLAAGLRMLHVQLGDLVDNVRVEQRPEGLGIGGRIFKLARPLHRFSAWVERGPRGRSFAAGRKRLEEYAGSGNFTISRVRSVRPLGTEEVYDLQIPETHNFIADGVVVHNCDTAILVAHRMPSDRVGMTKHGPLGGSVAEAANRVYREGVVLPDQEVLNHRINLFVHKELESDSFLFRLVELDTKAEKNDLTGATLGFRSGLYNLDEARARAGLPPIGQPYGEQFIWDLGGIEDAHAIKSAQAQAEGDRMADELRQRLSLIDRTLLDLSMAEEERARSNGSHVQAPQH